MIEEEMECISKVMLGANKEVQSFLEKCGSIPLNTGTSLVELIRRPELSYDLLAPLDKERRELPEEVREQVNINVKYDRRSALSCLNIRRYSALEVIMR